MDKLDKDLVIDTFKFWKKTRLLGVSGSIADNGGPFDRYLLQVFDRVVREQKEHDDKQATQTQLRGD